MILIGALLLLFWSLFTLADCSDSEARWERDYEISERRHRELMETRRNVPSEKKKRTIRRVLKKDGVVIGEEIIEEDI